MAKKSKDQTVITDDNGLKDLIKSINKDSSEGVVAYAMEDNDSPSQVREWFPVGIKVLDVLLSNQRRPGFPCGRIVALRGENSAGKTLIAMYTAKKVQEENGFVIWLDTENAFSESLADLVGLKYKTDDRFLYMQPNNITQTFTLIEKSILALRSKYPSEKLLVVWDSLAATPSSITMDNGYSQATMALAARELSQNFNKIKLLIGKLRCLFLVLNQVRQNIGNPYEPISEPGGKSLGFYASIRMHISQSSKIKDAEDNVIGNIIKFKILKNRMGPAFRECEVKMYYTRGVDELESVIDVLVDSGMIKKKGGWYEYNDVSYRKTDLCDMLRTDKEFETVAMDKFYEIMIQIPKHDTEEILESEPGDLLLQENESKLKKKLNRELTEKEIETEVEILVK